MIFPDIYTPFQSRWVQQKITQFAEAIYSKWNFLLLMSANQFDRCGVYYRFCNQSALIYHFRNKKTTAKVVFL